MTRRNKVNLSTKMLINIATIIICAFVVYFIGTFLKSVSVYCLASRDISKIETEAGYYGWTNDRKRSVVEIREQIKATAQENDIVKWCYLSQKTVTGSVTKGLVAICALVVTCLASFFVGYCLKEWILYFIRLIKTYVRHKKLAKEVETFNATLEEDTTE